MNRRLNPTDPRGTARRFLKHHLGRDCFAAFTGQDSSAWSAFVYACELYGRGDMAGREHALNAMRALVYSAQPTVRHMFAWTIPAILDWTHPREMWPTIAPYWKTDTVTTIERTGGVR